jgi:hypothetical protein
MFYGSQGEEKAARKLRDNIPKASMRYSFLSVGSSTALSMRCRLYVFKK